MKSIQQIYIDALLADATYVNFLRGTIGNGNGVRSCLLTS